MSNFRFSPNPNRAHLIDWQPWAAQTFQRAQAEDRPVLVSVSAMWCYWCHVMDETSYSDRDVQDLLAGNFIAVRVDNDHRPDINSRYNVGGWPTTAFLTPHGGLVGGATYLPPDQFLAMLSEMQEAYRADKPSLYTQARDLFNRRRDHARRTAAGPPIDAAIGDRVARIMAGAYDAINGGFGDEPKFTNPAILRFLVHMVRTTGEDFYRSMLRKTLDRMAEAPVNDSIDGGFFRHSTTSNWSEPQREKLLDDNLHLARCYLDASILLDEPRYRAVAETTIDYIMGHLYDDAIPGFRGSQGAHSDYFALSAAERAAAAPPAPDPSCYVNNNALAAVVLLEASWKLDRSDLAETALRSLEHIWSLFDAGESSHVYAADGIDDGPVFLIDWAWLLSGLMQAHASTADQGYLDRAVRVASVLADRYFDEDRGGFFDIESDEEAVGHLQIREKPLPDNMAAVEGLLRLYQTTRNEDYRQLCEGTLSAFVETYREHGEFSAEFGLAVRQFENAMVEVTVEGRPDDPACQELLRAAVRLPSPNLDIKTVRSADGDRGAWAHVCLDTVCLPPVGNPSDLAAAVSGLVDQRQSPFDDILRIFPGA